MKPSPIDDCETFRLDDDCIGVVWHDATGWHGNLHWDVLGDTDFCGPYLSIIQARRAVRVQFVSWQEATSGQTP